MSDASTSTEGSGRRPFRPAVLVVIAVLAAAAGITAFVTLGNSSTPHLGHAALAATRRSTTTNPSTMTTKPSPTSTTTTAVPLPTAGPGFVAGHVTAIGDSVMLDYQDSLESDIPGISVDAAVSRQWVDGETILQQLKAAGELGAEVVVALSTNGPITSADFGAMMSILNGASRVVFVNIHVNQPWQDPNNAVLAAGAAHYPNVHIADWASLAAQNPQWFGPDGTHLAIDGPGADALASLVASTLDNG